MDCRRFQKSVDDFDALSEGFAVHVQSCVECERWLGEMRMIAATITASLRESPPPAFATRVRARIEARRPSARAVFGLGWAEAIAACLVLCAISFVGYYFDFLGFTSATMESMMATLPDFSRWFDRLPAVPTVHVDLSWLNVGRLWQTGLERWLAMAMLLGAVALHEAINRRSYKEYRESNSGGNRR